MAIDIRINVLTWLRQYYSFLGDHIFSSDGHCIHPRTIHYVNALDLESDAAEAGGTGTICDAVLLQ